MEIKPFKAFRFNEAIVGDVCKCIAPPYDVIDPAQRNQLYKKSKYNIIRITKGKPAPSDNSNSNQYTRAAQYLNTWLKEGALKQDSTESIYAYIQDFELAGVKFRRLSFIALAKLEEFGPPGPVRPHERTLDSQMLDRLNLKRATAADLGLVFMLYEDKKKIADKIIENAAAQKPLVDCLDDRNVRHRLFAVTAGNDINAITKTMRDKTCIIADGHHRYATGLIYSKENSNPAARYQMLAFTNTHQEGLLILAAHRLVGNLGNFCLKKLIADLEKDFEITHFRFDCPDTKIQAKQKMLARMKAEHKKDKNAFGIYAANTFYVAVLKDKRAMDSVAPNTSAAWKSLDVAVLHKLVLEKLLGIGEEDLASDNGQIEYIKDTKDAIDESIERVDKGQKQIAFFMNPPRIHQIQMVADAGERLPQKSTYFYPKMYSGLTINKL
jgi:uncharacterized protein (DUF1015 family)